MSESTEAGAATAVAPAETEAQTPAVGAPAPAEATPQAQPAVEIERTEPQEGQSARDRHRAAFLERQKRAREQPRGEDGKFVSPAAGDTTEGQETETEEPVAEQVAEPEEVEVTEAAEPEAAAEAAPEAQTEEQPEAGAPEPPQQEKLVRIPLPEGHSLRSQGREYITALASEEREVRAAINSDTRRREVDEARAEARREIQQLKEELIRVRAETDANAALRESLLRDPNIRARFEAIYESSPDDAEVWLAGLEAQQQPEIRKRIEEQIKVEREKEQEAERVRTVLDFRSDATQRVRDAFPQFADLPHVWDENNGLLERAFRSYGAAIDMQERLGETVTLDVDALIREHLNPILISDTQIRARLAKQREEQDASRKAAEQRRAEADANAKAKQAEAERLKDAAARHKTKSPAAQIPSEVRTGAQSTSGEETPDFTSMTPDEIKKYQRSRFLGR